MKIRQTILRLRLLTSKKARTRYNELQERLVLRDISAKAHLHREQEARALDNVRQKVETHEARKMKIVVKAGDAKLLGDKILLTGRRTPADAPSTYRASAATGLVQVEEAAMSEDQFRNILDARHTEIKKVEADNYRQRRVEKTVQETTTIAPSDALHFMSTGKIPVRTRAELTEIVEMGGIQVEEVEVGNDAAALLYLTGRNHRK